MFGLCAPANAVDNPASLLQENLYSNAYIEGNILHLDGTTKTVKVDKQELTPLPNVKLPLYNGYFRLKGKSEKVTLSGIEGTEISPSIALSQHSISVTKRAELKVTGDVTIKSVSTDDNLTNLTDLPALSERPFLRGNYLFYANKKGTIELQADINILAKQDLSYPSRVSGNNVFFATQGSTISLGSETSTTKAWAIAAKKPNLFSSKNGSSLVELKSTSNQLVGSMDMIDMSYIYYMRPQYEPIALSSRSQNPWKALTKPDTIQGTFSGANSYWFGDERSYMNAKGTSLGLVDLIENHEDELREQIELIEEKIPSAIGLTAQSSTEKAKSDVDKKLKQLKKKSEKIAKSWERKGNRLVKNGQKAGDVFDLTFENGAQWSYLGIPVISDQDLMKTLAVIVAKANEGLDFSELKDFGMVESIQKRISSITLRDGGIINIDDDDLHQTWAKLGLTQEFADVGINLEELTDHNYVRIGNLKGDNGIFRLDLNGRDKYKSDMIFIESAQLATAKNKNS